MRNLGAKQPRFLTYTWEHTLMAIVTPFYPSTMYGNMAL